MANEDDKPEPTVRPACTLSAKTHRYLEKLAKAGTHGSKKVSGVMTFIINQGVQDAIVKGFIKMDLDD